MGIDTKQAISRRQFTAGTLAASALAMLAGCSGEAGAGAGSASSGFSSSDRVFRCYLSEPAYIDPNNAQETQGALVVHALFDPLVTWDWSTNAAVPLAAAELPSISEDGLTYTFKLREGMTFHNGDPVDAESFRRGWERLADPNLATPSEIGYHLSPVLGYAEMAAGEATSMAGLACPDELTFQVTLIAPMADFLAVCCHPGLSPVPQAALDDQASFLEAPIGNGPFMMDGAWQHNQYINLVRFDDYYGEAPAIEGIYFDIKADPDTAFSEFEAGDVDFAPIPTGRIQDTIDAYGKSEDGYTAESGKQVLTGSQANTYFITLNISDPILSDVNVRRALSLAINRQNIVDTLYEGTRAVATSIFPPVIDDDPEDAWEYCTYDTERAGQLLDKAGYPADENGKRNLTLTLSYDGGRGHEDIMSSIQADLANIGVTIEQESLEWAALLPRLGDAQFQMGRSGWTADYPTMDNFLYPNFYSTANDNSSTFNNPDIDAALDAARQITDDEDRKVAYRQICHAIGQDVPVIPIMHAAHNYVVSERVKSFMFDAQLLGDFKNAEIA